MLRAVLLSIAPVLAPWPARHAQGGELPSARELFAAAARAFAPEAILPPATLVLRGRVRATDAGVHTNGTWTELHRAGATRITLELEGRDAIEEGAASGVVWERGPDGARRFDGFDADARLRRFAWYCGSGWRDGYRELRAPRKAGDGRASLSLVAPFRRCEHQLEFAGREVLDTLTLDLATGRPVELVLADHTRSGRPVERVLELAAWRSEGGRAWPTERRERFGELVLEVTIETIEVDAELAHDALAPPAELSAQPEFPADADAIRVRTLSEQPTAVIRVTCAPADVGRELAVALPELARALLVVGGRASGAPFARRHAAGPAALELEFGLPVAEPIEPEGRVVPSSLPAGDVATAWHVGSHGTLDATRARLERWVDEHGFARRGPLWEVYWADPGSQPDQAKWRTEILCPIEREQ